MNETDTIAAIATARGEAGVSVIRISGENSIAIADTIFTGNAKKPSDLKGGEFIHGYIKGNSKDDEYLDEVIVLVYRRPQSYTKEDIVEIQGHGGSAVPDRLLRRVLSSGARLAEPGEFTKRAFLNGRIDLVQAEAIADLVKAKNDLSAGAAMRQLRGELSDALNAIYAPLLSLTANLEAALDFEESDVALDREETLKEFDAVMKALDDLRVTFREGRIFKDGARVVISGKTNVGKSTLLNLLLGVERAITTGIHGTTRDYIEEPILLNGIPVRLIDTAGFRESDCAIETKSIERSHSLVKEADLNIHVVASDTGWGDDDEDFIRTLDPERTLIVISKTDIAERIRENDIPAGFLSVFCNLLDPQNKSRIASAISEKLALEDSAGTRAFISERHKTHIDYVQNIMNDVRRLMQTLGDEEVILICSRIREALERLSMMLGKDCGNDLLDSVFSRFCLGK